MRKKITAISLITLILLMTGCFNSDPKVLCTTTVATGKYKVTEDVTATIKDDKISKLKFNIQSDLSQFEKKDKTNYLTTVKNAYAKYESAAMTSTAELKDNKVIVLFDIDLEKASAKEIKDYSSEFVQFSTNTFTVESYKKAMTKIGYKCS